eukprot:2429124-Prymnesium_polylepis.1
MLCKNRVSAVQSVNGKARYECVILTDGWRAARRRAGPGEGGLCRTETLINTRTRIEYTQSQLSTAIPGTCAHIGLVYRDCISVTRT